MLTFRSDADTQLEAATNAVLLAQDTGQDVLLFHKGANALIYPHDSSAEALQALQSYYQPD